LHLLLNKNSLFQRTTATEEKVFLQNHLPPDFRMTTREIINRTGNITGQLDIVIVNDDTSIKTFDLTDSIIAPIHADRFYASLKSNFSLTIESLKKELSQIRPVKALMP
jgi:hypothetical protein